MSRRNASHARAKGDVENGAGVSTGEASARQAARNGSERLLIKMHRVIDAYANRYGVDEFVAAVELQNCKVRP